MIVMKNQKMNLRENYLLRIVLDVGAKLNFVKNKFFCYN